MKKALSQYAVGNDGTVFPTKKIDKLFGYIDATIAEADEFLQSLGISLDAIIENDSTLDRLDDLAGVYDTVIANDDNKEKFKVILNTMMNLYDASKNSRRLPIFTDSFNTPLIMKK